MKRDKLVINRPFLEKKIKWSLDITEKQDDSAGENPEL